MYYEINVSLNGYHYFATHERSVQTERQMKEMVHTFKKKFPKSEGYEITCTRWENQGTPIDIQ
jgi:hypothetical protein